MWNDGRMDGLRDEANRRLSRLKQTGLKISKQTKVNSIWIQTKNTLQGRWSRLRIPDHIVTSSCKSMGVSCVSMEQFVTGKRSIYELLLTPYKFNLILRGVNKICALLIWYNIWYDMIWYYMLWYLFTTTGFTPRGSSILHIYTQTIHRTTQGNRIDRLHIYQ
jgi:hypothetical protein